MSGHHELRMSKKMRSAVEEIKGKILEHFPEATFEVGRFPEEEDAIEIWVTVDMDDPFDPVMDIVVERLMDLLIEDGLPLHVIAVPTPERAARQLAQAWEEYRQRQREKASA